MIERTQPVNTGLDEKGELVWGIVPMARWQMEMIRVRYYGDFMAHWIMRQFTDVTGHEAPEDFASMELTARKGCNKTIVYRHPGD